MFSVNYQYRIIFDFNATKTMAIFHTIGNHDIYENNITIFTDGSSRGNPGPGGFGAVVVVDDFAYELGGEKLIPPTIGWNFRQLFVPSFSTLSNYQLPTTN